MQQKLEQTGIEINPEVPNLAEQENSSKPLPRYLRNCLELIKTPDIESPTEIDIRCIYLADGRVFFGVLFFETVDSFLVGANAKLVMDNDKKIVAEPISPMPVMRIFKSNTVNMTKALPKFQYYYYIYLQKYGVKILPDFVNGDRLQAISDFIQEFSETNIEDAKAGASSPRVNDGSVSVKELLERKWIPGVSDLAFYPYQKSDKIH